MNFTEAIEYLTRCTRCADEFGTHWYEGRAWAMANCPNDIASCPTCGGSNDAGHLRTPGSRYGHTSAHCAPVAYRVARIDGDTSAEHLEYVMGLVVNDSDYPEATIRVFCEEWSGADVDVMVTGYLDAQLWLQYDANDPDGNRQLDESYDLDDISPEYVAKIREEFYELVSAHPLAVRMYIAQRDNGKLGNVDACESFGHDFLLTRDGHGAGFWDRGLGELGDYLTKIAESAGSSDDLWDNGNGVLA